MDLRKDGVRVAAGSERQVAVYPEEQLERLLSHVRGGGASARDRAIVLTLLYTGVRVIELCGIRVRDVDLLTGTVGIVGKGGKFREVPLRRRWRMPSESTWRSGRRAGTPTPSTSSWARGGLCGGTP